MGKKKRKVRGELSLFLYRIRDSYDHFKNDLDWPGNVLEIVLWLDKRLGVSKKVFLEKYLPV